MKIVHRSGEPGAKDSVKFSSATSCGCTINKAFIVEDFLMDLVGDSRIKKDNIYDGKIKLRLLKFKLKSLTIKLDF